MTAAYLTLDAKMVRFDIEALMRAYPELAEDDELRGDMLAGETQIDEVLTRLFLAMRHREGLANGVKAIRDDLDARMKRHQSAAGKISDIMLTLLETAHLTKRELPVATLSVRKGSISTVIDDVDALPQGYSQLVKQPVSKTEIKAAILALPKGESFPGAHIEIGNDSLGVRPK